MKSPLERLRLKALELPAGPGVYLMKDEAGEILYVGKAKLLPRRVAGYFQKTPASPRLALMLSRLADFDFVVTSSEKEALILENSLIKKYRPKFNVILRDDKTYPSLRLTAEEYPRLEIVRRPGRDGSTVFGPFPSAGALRDTVKAARRLFPLRQCRRPEVKNIDRPCLNHQMGRCLAPCRPEASPDEYRRLTEEVRLFFHGRGGEIAQRLTLEMKAAAERYDYEAAARLRDRLANIKKTLEPQAVARTDGLAVDVFGFCRQDGFLEGAVLFLRNGAATGCQPLETAAGGCGEGDELALLTQYYDGGAEIPDKILWPGELPEAALLSDWLAGLKGREVKIKRPRRGDKIKLLELARENARAALEERLNRLRRNRGALAEIMDRLALGKTPRRLECFDLAHLGGTDAAAGLAVMEDGEWKKEHYRRFRLKKAQGGDDYGGLREVVARRFSHADWPRPDLLLIDGGPGQLAATLAAFDDLGQPPPPLAAIAKIRREGDTDRIFLPGRKNPADLKAGSAGLALLARLRDEAHRYVNAFHRRLRARSFMASPLLSAPGLGPARRKKLLARFGSLEEMARASADEIRAAAGVAPAAAEALRLALACWRTESRTPTEIPEADLNL